MGKYRNKIMHDVGPNVFVGEYEMTDAALARYNVAREQFGNTRVNLPDGRHYVVKDFPYEVEDGVVGMRIVPASDVKVIEAADGRIVPGYQLVDEHLRSAMDLDEKDPVFAYLSYFHPEQNEGDLAELLMSKDTTKLELGITHTGTYIGRGVTSNSPVAYHRHQFELDGHSNNLDGYPAHVFYVSLEGVSQKVLNANGLLADSILNHGVNFPLNYEQARFRIVDLNTVFMFYRDWLRRESYLMTDQSWFTYCMVHKSIVTNVMLNLPHNEGAFCEVYGEKEGKGIFQKFKVRYYNIMGFDFTTDDETDFEPLWKKEGLSPEEIRPLPLSDYLAYESMRNDGKLSNYAGPKPLEPTQGTAWGPFYNADLVINFVSTYASLLDAGAIASAAVVLGFKDAIDDRMGISELEYLKFAMPILKKMMVADAQVNASKDPENYLVRTFVALFNAFGGSGNPAKNIEEIIEGIVDSGDYRQLLEISGKESAAAFAAGWALWDVVKNWESIIKAPPLSPEVAYEKYCMRIEKDIEDARRIPVAAPGKIQNNMLPAVMHLASIGAFPHNEYIRVNTVCTLVQEKDVQLKQAPAR